MPPSEAADHVHKPTVSNYATVVVLRVLTVLAWVLALALTVTDSVDIAWPRAVTNLVIAVAGTSTAVAVILSVVYRHQDAAAADHGLLLTELATLTAQMGELSAKMQTVPSGAIVTRLRQLAATNGQSNGHGKLAQSEYYQVYADVLTDLCGLNPDDEPPEVSN